MVVVVLGPNTHLPWAESVLSPGGGKSCQGTDEFYESRCSIALTTFPYRPVEITLFLGLRKDEWGRDGKWRYTDRSRTVNDWLGLSSFAKRSIVTVLRGGQLTFMTPPPSKSQLGSTTAKRKKVTIK
jgi:hypothetical protein